MSTTHGRASVDDLVAATLAFVRGQSPPSPTPAPTAAVSPPPTQSPRAAAIADGRLVEVDVGVFEELQELAALGEKATAAKIRAGKDEVCEATISRAVEAGKFTAARAQVYRDSWAKNPKATAELIDKLAAPLRSSTPSPRASVDATMVALGFGHLVDRGAVAQASVRRPAGSAGTRAPASSGTVDALMRNLFPWVGAR